MPNPKSLARFRPTAQLAFTLTLGLLATGCARPERTFYYPEARKGNQVDVYHGIEVPDPYRWLEDPDSEETRAWIEAQNELTFGYLESIPQRNEIKNRITELWNYEKYTLPGKKGGRYFFRKNDGLQNQDVLYTMDSLDAEPRVLLDPNQLSEDGTVSMGAAAITDDGKLMAYSLSTAGSDWQEWRVRNVDTGKDLNDHLKWVKFSRASWTKDGEGFYYSRYDAPSEKTRLQEANYYQKLCYHRLGTPQSQDQIVYHRPDKKEWSFGGSVTDDDRYLIISVGMGTDPRNMVFYQDRQDPNAEVVELISEFEAEYDFIDNDGPVFWFQTDLEAPNGRVIAIDARQPERVHWKEVIPETKDALRSVSMVGDHFIASYLEDAHTRVKVFDVNGRLVREVAMPELGSAYGFYGKRDDPETFYMFTSFTDPGSIYRYDVTTGEGTLFRRPRVDFDPEDYETRQVFYHGKDGTRVPMFIVHRKELKLNGHNPTVLYGYGGFNVALTPWFSVSRLVWMEMGGAFALANIRGGGEYGKAWHEAARKLKRQNAFDDFIAAAEWLIDNGYTSSEKLAIMGASNGGTLVGACMTQRPDLFGAVLPDVGVMDLLRFHKYTIGWAWVSDYGSPDDPEEFRALYAYSPLHNIEPGTAYPATLITTADHDDRVVPAHSFKFSAALQEAHAGSAPVLIRVQTKAGHGAGMPTMMRIEEISDVWAFLVDTFDMRPRFP